MTLPPALATVTATSVGSLPHADPVRAAELVLRSHPDLPAAPQLPNRSKGELMLAQAADGIDGVTMTPDGELAVSTDDLNVVDAESFGDFCWDGLLTFLRLTRDREEPVKLQLTGPVTLAVALVRGGAPPRLAVDVATEAVRRRVHALAGLAATGAFVLCLDEPWLARAHPAIAVDDVIEATVDGLGTSALVGVHCCGNADWDTVIDRLAAPAVASVPLSADCVAALGRFITRGGVVAWGAVPTTPPVVTDPELLWPPLRARLRALVDAGCAEDELRQRSWITPECGLAGHTEDSAESILVAARDLAELVPDRGL